MSLEFGSERACAPPALSALNLGRPQRVVLPVTRDCSPDNPMFFLHVVTCGEVAWFVSVWEVFVEQKWPLLPGGNYECK